MQIGQQVICVDQFDDPGADSEYGTNCPYLRDGAIYTIRDIDYRLVALHGFPVIRLEEIIHEAEEGFEPGYCPNYFRPLAPTNISIFTNMVRAVEHHLAGVKL